MTIEVRALPELPTSHPAAEHVTERLLYTWSPPERLIEKLPADYSVALECWRFSDNVRRFCPANPRERSFSDYTVYDATAFALETSVGGRALLWYRGEKTPSPWLTYEAACLLMQYAQHLREHLGPTRNLGESLYVCMSGRQVRGEADILPANIGLDENGNGERWTVGRLKEEGRRTATERGIENPTPNDILRLGLVTAAEYSPLKISESESEYITRAVIYRMDSDLPRPSDELLALVATQINASIKKKEGVTNEEFQKWIEDRHSDLIRSIQKATRGAFDRNQIRAALLELAWHSVKLFGRSVDEQMRVFLAAIPEPLTAQEKFLFEQLFLANPMFSGLPLILLHDRFPFLNEVIPDFWTTPADERNVLKIQTMLYFYGVIVGNVRDAEALTKRRRHPHGTSGGSSREEQLHEDSLASPSTSTIETLHDVIRALAVQQGVIPRTAADDWTVSIVRSDEEKVEVELSLSTGQDVTRMSIARSVLDVLVKAASE